MVWGDGTTPSPLPIREFNMFCFPLVLQMLIGSEIKIIKCLNSLIQMQIIFLGIHDVQKQPFTDVKQNNSFVLKHCFMYNPLDINKLCLLDNQKELAT